MSDTKPQTLRTDTQTRGAPTGFPSDRPRKHTRPRGCGGSPNLRTSLCGAIQASLKLVRERDPRQRCSRTSSCRSFALSPSCTPRARTRATRAQHTPTVPFRVRTRARTPSHRAKSSVIMPGATTASLMAHARTVSRVAQGHHRMETRSTGRVRPSARTRPPAWVSPWTALALSR